MATPAHVLRLSRDYKSIQKSPVPYVLARPSPTNIVDWSYIITGPPDTPYAGGQYYGRLIFPQRFPYAAPSITMSTPSGRFKTNTPICTTFTNMHPEEWNPAWTVESILTGFLSFMTGEEPGTGSLIGVTIAEKRKLAVMSKRWNSLECTSFVKDFPEAHAENLAIEKFTAAERKALSSRPEEDTTPQIAITQETLLDNSFESHVNEDWEKFGSMEDEFDSDEDEEDGDEEDGSEEEYGSEGSETPVSSPSTVKYQRTSELGTRYSTTI